MVDSKETYQVMLFILEEIETTYDNFWATLEKANDDWVEVDRQTYDKLMDAIRYLNRFPSVYGSYGGRGQRLVLVRKELKNSKSHFDSINEIIQLAGDHKKKQEREIQARKKKASEREKINAEKNRIKKIERMKNELNKLEKEQKDENY